MASSNWRARSRGGRSRAAAAAVALAGAALASPRVAGPAWSAGEPAEVGAARCPPRQELAPGPLVLDGPALPWRHASALGEAAGLWGPAGGALEAWAYPFKMLDGLELAFSLDGGASFLPAASLLRGHRAEPHITSLRLAHDRFAVTQYLFVPRARPAVLLLLEIDTATDLVVAVRLRPALVPMLMSAGAPAEPEWDPARLELVARQPDHGLELRVAAPLAQGFREAPRGGVELLLRVTRELARARAVPIAAALAWPGGTAATDTLDALLAEPARHVAAAREHFRGVLERAPDVVTPDPRVDAAMRWSAVSLDQLRVCNPFLGCSLVSGYSGSGGSSRPRYAWFFDEPTLASWALHRAGLSGHAREALAFLQRYQRADGKTVHEVTQSLAQDARFLAENRYAYIHTDGPVYLVAAFGQYYRATGDREFIAAEWPGIRRALEWCLAQVDPADGLIRIAPEDWGSAESSFEVLKDTQLEGMWVAALESVAELAAALGEPEFAAECRGRARQAADSIEAQLWNEPAGTYLWGLDREGRPLAALVPHHAVSIWLGTLRLDRARRALETMGTADFRADWGVRSLSLADPGADPAAYQTGSIWPVWNAGVIIGDFRHGRAVEGFRLWRALIEARTFDALGPMPEVLDGRSCRRLEEGVPHQLFSEVAVQNGFYDGMLGLDVDLPRGRLRLAPWLPPCWNRVAVERIPVGRGRLDLVLSEAVGGERVLELTPRFEAPLRFELAPLLPAGAAVDAVELDGAPWPFTRAPRDDAVAVQVALEGDTGRRLLRIRHSGGVAWFPEDRALTPGAPSRNLRLVRATLEGSRWEAVVEGRPGQGYAIEFLTDRAPARWSGAAAPEPTPRGFRLPLAAPPAGVPGAAGYVRWPVALEFAPAAAVPVR